MLLTCNVPERRSYDPYELLDRALNSCATIHQPHALKAYLSASYLYEYFEHPYEIWSQTSDLIGQSEVRVSAVFTQIIQAPELPEFRIKRILQRGVYPVAYQALFQWHKEKGFDDIFSYYVSKMSHKSEYLSHNVTILLALSSVYKQLAEDQVPAFLNRFTEFLTSTLSNHDQVTTDICDLDVTDVLSSCLTQFGFFGHNLIALTWILRCKDSLSQTDYKAMLSNLYMQANSPLEDPEDEADLRVLEQCTTSDSIETFTETVYSLLFDFKSNLHQVTLADALCFLQESFPERTAALTRVADYHCRVLQK